jgi:hypothetical protein
MADRLSVARLREFFTYDPITGLVYRGSRVVGHKTAKGRYLGAEIDGREIPAHVIAWALMTGAWPKCQIDHVNRNGTDNRWSNLREASAAEQQVNRVSWAKSGRRGVTYSRGKWQANIRYDKKTHYLGRFDDPDLAAKVVMAARIKRWGQFATEFQ